MLLDISRYAATLQLQCSYMWVIANDPLSTLLPLCHALKDNAPLGSIDLLIKGNIQHQQCVYLITIVLYTSS